METKRYVSDDDDRRVFESLEEDLVNEVIHIKHNDPNVNDFFLNGHRRDLNERACRRLGHILGRNTNLDVLAIDNENFNPIDVAGLCVGLQNNRCIRNLNFIAINLRDPENMSILAPFFSHNPSLNAIDLRRCRLTRDSMSILSDALANRSHNTIETLGLSENRFGDFSLDGFVEALSGSKSLRVLLLNDNGIGQQGCTSLARLLENQELNLNVLHLDGNSIDDDCAIILSASLTNNTKLDTLCLDDNRIGARGWSALLKLVCNCSSIRRVTNSNHTLSRLGWNCYDSETVDRALGVDDASLFKASLNMNQNGNKMLVARRKILWSHARGDINLGNSDIAMRAMPSILAWIGNGTDEAGARLIQYHKPPLSELELGLIALDSVYRILRRRAYLCSSYVGMEGLSTKLRLCVWFWRRFCKIKVAH